MRTENSFKAAVLDATIRALEVAPGRRALNRIGGYLYWRTRGENLDDPARNGENRLLEILARRVLGPRPVALDVGANVGDWAALFVQASDGGRVFAFEPVAGTFGALQRRFAGEPRAECRQIALSDRAGPAEMHLGEALSGSNSLHVAPESAAPRAETVALMTGDAFLAEHGIESVDVVKIDVEGHEIAVLRGLGRTIAAQRVRFIQWEYNKTWLASRTSLGDAFALLAPAGYRLCKVRPRGLLHYAAYRPALDNFCYSNWLAVAERDFAALGAQIRIETDTAGDW
jgi:FkbM family methyltransferase